MEWAILFIILNSVNCVMLGCLGYGVSELPFWISDVCVCGAYLCGCFYQRSRMWR